MPGHGRYTGEQGDEMLIVEIIVAEHITEAVQVLLWCEGAASKDAVQVCLHSKMRGSREGCKVRDDEMIATAGIATVKPA